MPCFEPWYGYLGPNGQVVNLRRPTDFNPEPGPVCVPCGNCLGCRKRQKRDWSIRLQHECMEPHEFKDEDGNVIDRCADQACFITLTYDPEHLPQDGLLVLDDWQRFAKRLRKALGRKRLRFYECGEYGGKRLRPHFHAALYGHDFAKELVPFPQPGQHQVFTADTLSRAWGLGMAVVAPLTPETCNYIAGYVTKKVGSQADTLESRAYVWDEIGRVEAARPPEFSTQSLGIGRTFLEKHYRSIYANDSVELNGFQFPVPRYYDKLMEQIDPAWLAEVKAERLVRFERNKHNHSLERLTNRKRHAEIMDARNKRAGTERDPDS